MRRYLVLISAVIIQICLGATYSWSIYVEPLKELANLSQGQVQLPFSVFYFAFPATVVITGAWLLPRFGPQFCAAIGGAIFGSGWILASLGHLNFALTILGIGLVAGFGAGLAYLVPIAVCIQWFPRHQGLVTGIAVAGFGGGAALVSLASNYLITNSNQSPYMVFSILGICFVVLSILAGLNLQNAPGQSRREYQSMQPLLAIKQRNFRLLYFAMLTGLMAGFAINANLRELYSGTNLSTGVTAVSLFAIANALGRIGWGAIADRCRSSITIRINLIAQALTLLAAPQLVHSTPGFLTIAFLAGFNYGGVLVIYAASITHLWGQAHMAQFYGLLFSANIPAAASPVLAGICYDRNGDFTLAISILFLLLLTAAWLIGRRAQQLDISPSVQVSSNNLFM